MLEKLDDSKQETNLISQTIHSEISSRFHSTESDLENRISFIDIVTSFCKEKNFEKAINLVETYYSNDLKDGRSDITNLGNHLCRSLVEYNDDFTFLTETARMLDNEPNRFTHLKKITYYVMLKQNSDLILKLIDELKKNQVEVKIHFFYPLIIKESMKLNKILEEG